jgi:hypothetical protein
MPVIISVPDDGYYECTWWRLLWVYLMTVIMGVPDDSFSNKSLCALTSINWDK